MGDGQGIEALETVTVGGVLVGRDLALLAADQPITVGVVAITFAVSGALVVGEPSGGIVAELLASGQIGRGQGSELSSSVIGYEGGCTHESVACDASGGVVGTLVAEVIGELEGDDGSQCGILDLGGGGLAVPGDPAEATRGVVVGLEGAATGVGKRFLPARGGVVLGVGGEGDAAALVAAGGGVTGQVVVEAQLGESGTELVEPADTARGTIPGVDMGGLQRAVGPVETPIQGTVEGSRRWCRCARSTTNGSLS